MASISDNQIESLVRDLTFVYFMLPYKVSHGVEMWRTRISNPGELYSHTDDLKYPPVKTATSRVAYSEEPIFYAASSPETAFAEARLQVGDFFHLGNYGVRSDDGFYISMIGDLDSLRRQGKTAFGISSFEVFYKTILDGLPASTKLAVQLVDAFFVDWLGRKGSDDVYRISNAITHEILTAPNLSGIVFHSVEHAGGYNYALKKECYDQSVEPLQVTPCTVRKMYGYGAYEMGQLESVKIKQVPGEILWPETPQYKRYRSLTVNCSEAR